MTGREEIPSLAMHATNLCIGLAWDQSANHYAWRSMLQRSYCVALLFSTWIPLAMTITVGSAWPVKAHSWYPRECCSDQDCVAAEALLTNGHGQKSVLVGQHQIPIPEGIARRSSPDGRVHICFQSWTTEHSGDPTFVIHCLFMPPEA